MGGDEEGMRMEGACEARRACTIVLDAFVCLLGAQNGEKRGPTLPSPLFSFLCFPLFSPFSLFSTFSLDMRTSNNDANMVESQQYPGTKKGKERPALKI